MRLALVLPPTTQLNTPYPSTAYLARSLRGSGIVVSQHDLGLQLTLQVLSSGGLAAVFDAVEAMADDGLPEPAWRALALRDRHLGVIDPVVRFLQGRDPTLAWRLARPGFLPGGPRLDRAAPGSDAVARFGEMGQHDLARYRATLYLEDVADLVTATVDPGFGIARYQHHLAHGPVSYAPIAARLAETSLLDAWLDALTDAVLADAPDVVGLSVPFPGTLYGALRVGQRARAAGAHVVMGGGYVNTELREVDEPRLWQAVDALTFDDGEGPLRALLDHLSGQGDRRHRTRTAAGWHRADAPATPFNPAPAYGDLPLGDYLQVLDTLNPAHRLWGDGRWNKLTVAHGCYWKRCAFCDVNLDYISRFEPAKASELVDAMAALVEETGERGFHLVDEAAPPRGLRDLALGLLDRGLKVHFWGNIRFERAFTPDLCRLLQAAGLTAVTGGLEVASDRLLAAMDKGITVEQAARAAAAFTDAGVLVHAYLMYGFPGQTAQEHVDAAEVVRQLFGEGVLQSAFWHRFVLTRGSRVYAAPEAYGVSFVPPRGAFAMNDLPHGDRVGCDPDPFDGPLAEMLGAWMSGRGLDRPVHRWFPKRSVPRATEAPDRVARALRAEVAAPPDKARLVWLGDGVLDTGDALVLLHAEEEVAVRGPDAVREWLADVLDAATAGGVGITLGEARAAFPGDWAWWQRSWAVVREAGLVAV